MKVQTQYILGSVVAAVLLIGGAIMAAPQRGGDGVETLALTGADVTFYRSPSCGCCAGHAQALEDAGATVKMQTVNETELNEIKEGFGIPLSKQSCHTAVVDGYVVEGHVPIEALVALRSAKPETRGITLPGMPIGTPGMPGPQTEPFIVEFLEGGVFWHKDPS